MSSAHGTPGGSFRPGDLVRFVGLPEPVVPDDPHSPVLETGMQGVVVHRSATLIPGDHRLERRLEEIIVCIQADVAHLWPIAFSADELQRLEDVIE